MTATFGKLRGSTLELQDGLNILQAPNETGKSTWCAFLLAILYGINSRERDRAGFIADKNRFAPWSGVSMSGRMDCSTDLGELTLTRATRRQTSPMGEFAAVYTGTNEPVPGLTGIGCGESLLGISREVFERSAFIRQNGLSISQDAELERRIAALISSGEEGTSYTEAAEALKKQLNRRRHNRTGQLPALEAELADLERQLADSSALARQLADARARRMPWPRGWRPFRASWPPVTAGRPPSAAGCSRMRQKPPGRQRTVPPRCGNSSKGIRSRRTRPSPGCGAPSSIWRPPERPWTRPGRSGTRL